MVHSDSNSLVICINFGLYGLMGFSLLGNFLDNSCLLCCFDLCMSLLFCLCVNLGTDLYSLLLMNLFMLLEHFNIVELILLWFLLWEVLNYGQGCVSIILVQFSSTTNMSLCINNVISVCINLLSLLQLNVCITAWWLRLLNMSLGLCKMSYIHRVAHWHRCLLWNIGTSKSQKCDHSNRKCLISFHFDLNELYQF